MKRLFYVACTRAKAGLHLIYELKQDSKGAIRKTSNTALLGLLPEIPEQLNLAITQNQTKNI